MLYVRKIVWTEIFGLDGNIHFWMALWKLWTKCCDYT